MATKVRVPQWGMGIKEGKIAQWLKREGDAVDEGEPIVEIETAKALQEVESPAGGVLAKILVEEGVMVPVREVIAIIAGPGESLEE
jgi:pyruvate/2-oxoglutarate dehydrogenase complex dihydrolipoamide acyltransferase (E2) component